MITFYSLRQDRLERLDCASFSSLPEPADVLWIDLCGPTQEEERAFRARIACRREPRSVRPRKHILYLR